MSKKFTLLREDVVDFFESIEKNLNLPIDAKYKFLNNPKQKCLIKISKLSDQMVLLTNSDLLIQINEVYFDRFDEEISKILIENELNRLEFNIDKGTIKIAKSDISTSNGIVSKYTFKSVSKAFETEKLLTKQLKDKKTPAEVEMSMN